MRILTQVSVFNDKTFSQTQLFYELFYYSALLMNGCKKFIKVRIKPIH